MLLVRLTTKPPVGAAALSVTVHASVPAPVIEELAHESPVNAAGIGVPVPLRLMMVAGPLDELLFTVSWPLAAPTAVGSNCTLSVTACPGFSVVGSAAPDTAKPPPVMKTLLIVRVAVPLDVSVTASGVAAEFTCTLPNARPGALTASVGTAAFNCTANVVDVPLAVAVRVAAWAVVTGDAAAVNVTWDELAGTVIVAGTATAALLLARLTTKPPVDAAAVSITVQESELVPVRDALAQLSPLSAAGTALPVPLSPITVAAPLEELLLMVSWPVDAPTDVGLNCTFTVTAWPGVSVTGNAAPVIVNPAPAIRALLTVSCEVPLDVSVIDCGVEAVFTWTFPKDTLLVLTVRLGTEAPNCSEKIVDVPPALAVRVAV